MEANKNIVGIVRNIQSGSKKSAINIHKKIYRYFKNSSYSVSDSYSVVVVIRTLFCGGIYVNGH